MDAPFELNEARFIELLTKLIGEAKNVQNMPPRLVPEEDKIVNHLLPLLQPHSTENGGPLKIQHVHFKEKRGNLIVEYKPESATKGTVAFVGSHLDVVPADPETWERDPFTLSVEGDKLYGRGTTDCLGHVALMTDMLLQLAETKPQLNVSVFVCFIASEENSSIPEVGVDMLVKNGGINALELSSDAVAEIQKRFYKDFPACEQETKYAFSTPSTMKPTKISGPENSVNQVPPWSEVQGDIRLTPFYNTQTCMDAVQGYVDDINANMATFGKQRGPVSNYVITEDNGDEVRGKLTLTWNGDVFKGIACHLDSKGYDAIVAATTFVKGSAKPYSICGSLPLVGDLQEAGFDLQISGYGKSSVYHGNNEFCSLSDMKGATKILSKVIMIINDGAK